MNLKEQTYICTLAECKSMTRASEILFITQPALSLYISNLEKNLGVKLFERIGKTLKLTYAGELYVAKAKKMLALKRQFDQEIEGILEGTVGKIRLGIQIRRGPYILAKILSNFAKEFPNIEVIVTEGTNDSLILALENNEIDFMLCSSMENSPNLEYKVIFEEPLLIALSEKDPLNKKAICIPGQEYPALDLNHLKDSKFILPDKFQSIRTMADRALMESHVYPKEVMIIRNIETAMHLVGEGMGVAFNRGGYVKYMYCEKPINYYTIANGYYYSKFVITWKKEMNLQFHMKKFIDITYEIFNPK